MVIPKQDNMTKMMKLTDEMHGRIRSIQSYLYRKYQKLVSQMIIMIHYSPSDKNKKTSEVGDRIYKDLEHQKSDNKN